jgi:hypothetical protein
MISGLHENTFKLGSTETLPPDVDRLWTFPEPSQADAPEIRMPDAKFDLSAARTSLTVATTPSPIPAVLPPHAMQVVDPAALLHEIDFPEAEAEGPGVTETEKKSALE